MKTLVIRYVRWGGSVKDARHRWEASIEGENDVYDWGYRSQHIKEALANGWNYKVLKNVKGRDPVIVEYNGLKIGDVVKSKKRQPGQIYMNGRFWPTFGYVSGRIQMFEMDGKMVMIGGLLYPSSIF